MSATIWSCECGAKYELREEFLGRLMRCRRCGVVRRVEKPTSINVPPSIPKATSVSSREGSGKPLNKTEDNGDQHRDGNAALSEYIPNFAPDDWDRRRGSGPEQSAGSKDTEKRKRLSPDEIDECTKRLAFVKANRELIENRAAEYMAAHPDESPEDVVDIVLEKCFLEHEIKRLKAEIEIKRLEAEVEATTARFREQLSSLRPLGNLTYKEASRYFTEYCALMERGCGMREKESSLPTSFDRMKEALKVECLNWCNHGRDFDESCDFIGRGYVMLNRFVRDELAPQRPRILPDGSHIEALRAYYVAFQAASEYIDRRTTELYVEWDEFRKKYRGTYSS